MPETKESPCALCDRMAQFEHHDSYQIRYYECPHCKYYAISERAIRYLEEHPENKPALAQEAAAMPHEVEILEITYQRAVGLNPARVSRTRYSQ